MIKTCIPFSAKQEFLSGIHQKGDDYKIALFTSKANLDETNSKYTGANEISGDGYKKGGQILSGYSVVIDRGIAILTFETPLWEKATILARGAVIYNSTKENRLIAIWDFGKDCASTNGPFTATILPATVETGLIRMT